MFSLCLFAPPRMTSPLIPDATRQFKPTPLTETIKMALKQMLSLQECVMMTEGFGNEAHKRPLRMTAVLSSVSGAIKRKQFVFPQLTMTGHPSSSIEKKIHIN